MNIIKVLLLGLLALLGLGAALLAINRLGAPAALLLLGVGAITLLLWNKVRRDPYVGWGTLRACGWMVALASGAWALVGFVANGLLTALPLAVIFGGAVLCIRHCTRKIEGSPANRRMPPGTASQNLEAANDLTSQIIANARRSQARGRSLNLQGENLQLASRNRELEGEVAKLKREAEERQAAMQDPFYDPIPKA